MLIEESRPGWSEVVSLAGYLAYIAAVGVHDADAVVAVELDPRSVNLFDASYPERPCFLLGAELGGVPPELLDEAAIAVAEVEARADALLDRFSLDRQSPVSSRVAGVDLVAGAAVDGGNIYDN